MFRGGFASGKYNVGCGAFARYWRKRSITLTLPRQRKSNQHLLSVLRARIKISFKSIK